MRIQAQKHTYVYTYMYTYIGIAHGEPGKSPLSQEPDHVDRDGALCVRGQCPASEEILSVNVINMCQGMVQASVCIGTTGTEVVSFGES